jgi:O-antigen ligase
VLPLAAGRFLGSFDFAEGSLTGRLGLWADTARIAAAAPLLGIGFGGLAGALEPLAGYRVPTNAHSTYLELLAETGVLGTTLFLAVLGTAVFFAIRQWRSGSVLQGAVAIAVLTFAVHGIFETNIFGVETTIILFALLALAASRKGQTVWKSSQ